MTYQIVKYNTPPWKSYYWTPQGVNSSRTHHDYKHKQQPFSLHIIFIYQIMANVLCLIEWKVIYILGLHDRGLTPLEIAIRFGRDKSTITCVLQNYSWETFTGLHSRPEPARHTSERDNKMLVQATLANRTTVLTNITNSMALTISPRTVQHHLKETGI